MPPNGIGGSLDDAAMKWSLGKLWLPPAVFAVTLTEGTPNLITSVGVQTPAIGELSVAAADLTGFKMDSGDRLTTAINVPAQLGDADLTRDLALQLFFESGYNGAATGIIWNAAFKGFAAGQIFSDVFTSPDKLVVFPTQTSLGQSLADKTPRIGLGIPSTFASDLWVGLGIELDNRGQTSADDIRFQGACLYYARSMTSASGVYEDL